MPTDQTDALERCVLVTIAYLERNDFTAIRQFSRHLLHALDGRRKVYVWIDLDPPRADGGFVVPVEVCEKAGAEKARVDVISLSVDGERVLIRHMMNA